MTASKMNGERSVINAFSRIDLAKRGLPIIVVIFIAIVIVKILLSLNFYAPFFLPDEYTYDNNARLLSEGNLYPYMGAVPPLYQVILSVSYHLSGDKNVIYHIMLGIGSIISSLIIFPAYFILKKYVAPLYAILGAVSISILPALNYFSFMLMLENLFIPLLLFAVLAIIEAFDTNKLSWQILAGISIALLEITRSLGQIIEYSFLITFLLYLIINRKNGIKNTLKSKLPMLLAFVLLFGTWHIFLQVMGSTTIQGAAGNAGNVGASYDALGFLSSIKSIIQSSTDFILYVKILLNHFNYVTLALCLIPFYILYSYVINRKNKELTSAGYQFSGLFILISALAMIFCATVLDVGMINSLMEFHFSLGRYLDPLLPPIFIFGLVSIYTQKSDDSKNRKIFYFIFMELAVLLIVFISTYPLNLAFDPKDYGNNPSLIYLYIANPFVYPLIVFATSIFSTIIMYYATVDKRAILILLLLFIAFSVICSYISYNLIIGTSEVVINNDINHYLYKNSNDQTIVLVDNDLKGPDYFRARYIYNFWNNGKSILIDVNDSNFTDQLTMDNVYLTTTANLTFSYIAVDNNIKLYCANSTSH